MDVVYACVPWKLHAPVALAAMRADKHAFVEVPATMDVDSCWELVETSEKTRRHCMMLENCCYGENEMLALNMCRLGVLGETVYGEAGYLHSGRTRGFKLSEFRAEWYQEHRGNYYPTHGLGPVAQYMNINRGDRFEYLNSMESTSIGDLIRAGDTRWNGENLETYKKYLIGGYSSSLIHTVNGKIILLNLSCPVPHPYSRINTIQGTHGIFMDYPLRIDVEDEPGSGPHEKRDPEFNDRFDRARTAAYREKYRHPLWKQAGELAKKAGGHGGMDFLMEDGLPHGSPLGLLPAERPAARHGRVRPCRVELPVRDHGEVAGPARRARGHPGLHARRVEDDEAARHRDGRPREDGLLERRRGRPAADDRPLQGRLSGRAALADSETSHTKRLNCDILTAVEEMFTVRRSKT